MDPPLEIIQKFHTLISLCLNTIIAPLKGWPTGFLMAVPSRRRLLHDSLETKTSSYDNQLSAYLLQWTRYVDDAFCMIVERLVFRVGFLLLNKTI